MMHLEKMNGELRIMKVYVSFILSIEHLETFYELDSA